VTALAAIGWFDWPFGDLQEILVSSSKQLIAQSRYGKHTLHRANELAALHSR
jgi:hypothetical protein